MKNDRTQLKQWQSSYEKLVSYVVPRSSKYLDINDKEGNQLWTVTLFKQDKDEFISKARSQLKVYVREVEYNEELYHEEKKKLEELTEKIQTMRIRLYTKSTEKKKDYVQKGIKT